MRYNPHATTGNKLRDKMLRDVLDQLDNGSSFQDAVSALPADFLLDEKLEWAAFAAPAEPDQAIVGEVEMIEAADTAGDAPVVEPEPAPPAVPSIADSEAAAEQADSEIRWLMNELSEAKAALTAGQRAINQAERERALAVSRFAYRVAPCTAEQNSRDFIKSELIERAKVASGLEARPPRPRVADSVLDRIGAFSRSDSPAKGSGLKRPMRPVKSGAFA